MLNSFKIALANTLGYTKNSFYKNYYIAQHAIKISWDRIMKRIILLFILISCSMVFNACMQSGFTKTAASRGNALSAGQVASSLAEAGDPHYQYSLGIYYEQGQNGLEKNLEKAVYWYQTAAKQNYLPAYVRLGLLYEFGNGLPRDKKMAVNYYETAALVNVNDFITSEYLPYIEMEIIFAQQQLGRLYTTGDGVQTNHVKGYMWNKIVLNHSHLTGRPEIDKIIKEYQELANLFNAVLDSMISTEEWKEGEEWYQQYLKDHETWQKEYASLRF